MTDTCHTAIIGGGIIGVSIARALASRFSDIVLIEKEPAVARHTSGRNSGVIHSGINPRPGTLKAKLCVEGSRAIRAYCRERSIPFEESGTLILALEESQIATLHELQLRGEKNGVPGLRVLDPADYRALEPCARGLAALHSPTGSIVDSQALTASLARDAQEQGVRLVTNAEVKELRELPDGVRLQMSSGMLMTQRVINCAGLQADRLAHQAGVAAQYAILPFRGEYFVLDQTIKPLVRSMIYPVPDLRFPFLGVHLTKMTSGKLLVGPNAVPAFGREAYSRGQWNLRDLWETVRRLGFWNAVAHNAPLVSLAWHELRKSWSLKHFLSEAEKLVEGIGQYTGTLETRAGIRAQLLRSDGELVEDLVIERTERSTHLLNVVSPGMTCSLAFADWFAEGLNAEGQWVGSLGEQAALA